MPNLTSSGFVELMPYANISGKATYQCADNANNKLDGVWSSRLYVDCLANNMYDLPDPVPSCIDEVICHDKPGKYLSSYLKRNRAMSYGIVQKKL